MRVQVRPRGFEQDFIVKDRAAADAVAAAGGSFHIPVKTKGLTAKATAEGGVEFLDAKGVRVSFIWHVLAAVAAWCLARHWVATGGPTGRVNDCDGR